MIIDLVERLILIKMQLRTGSRRLAVQFGRSTILQKRLLSRTSSLQKTTDSSSNASSSSDKSSATQSLQDPQGESSKNQIQKKTMAQLDEELRQKLEGMSGEGGASGIELEDGKPVAMKRGVRENMFRLI
jgi:hypothetical protein